MVSDVNGASFIGGVSKKGAVDESQVFVVDDCSAIRAVASGEGEIRDLDRERGVTIDAIDREDARIAFGVQSDAVWERMGVNREWRFNSELAAGKRDDLPTEALIKRDRSSRCNCCNGLSQ